MLAPVTWKTFPREMTIQDAVPRRRHKTRYSLNNKRVECPPPQLSGTGDTLKGGHIKIIAEIQNGIRSETN